MWALSAFSSIEGLLIRDLLSLTCISLGEIDERRFVEPLWLVKRLSSLCYFVHIYFIVRLGS